jgi:coenzyme F420-reducing hydrogenase gamma subunit
VQACSGGYPLPPTRCDEWCDVTKGAMCQDWYSPASCVAQCEESKLSADECRSSFDLTLTCFRSSPNALQQRCAYDNIEDDCQSEVETVSRCASSLFDITGYR